MSQQKCQSNKSILLLLRDHCLHCDYKKPIITEKILTPKKIIFAIRFTKGIVRSVAINFVVVVIIIVTIIINITIIINFLYYRGFSPAKIQSISVFTDDSFPLTCILKLGKPDPDLILILKL